MIEQCPDFLIAGQFSAYAREEGYGEEYKTQDAGQDPMLTEGSCFELLYDNDYDEFSPISADVRDELMDLDGVRPEESYIMEGAYLYAVISKKVVNTVFTPSDCASICISSISFSWWLFSLAIHVTSFL